jgi:branched-chain amino acid transport system substrate-binding protein
VAERGVVAYGHNAMGEPIKRLQDDYKKRFNDDYYTFATYNGMAMPAEGMAKAKSTEPAKVAEAMSGLRFKGFAGEVEMRKSRPPAPLQPLYITEWRKADAKAPYSVENTGLNFQEVKVILAYVAATPTSCQMKRPRVRGLPRAPPHLRSWPCYGPHRTLF